MPSPSKIRPFLPLFLVEALNRGIHLDLPVSHGDAGVNLAIVSHIYTWKERLQSPVAAQHAQGGVAETSSCSGEDTNWTRLMAGLTQAGEWGVTQNEVEILEGLTAASPAIAALSVHLSSSLCIVADTVAALSSEALKANVKAFDTDSSNEGFSYKLEADVGSDMRMLLFGSKLLTAKKEIEDGGLFSSIPAVHGSVREDVRVAFTKARIETNNAGSSKVQHSPSTSTAMITPLTTSLLSLVVNLRCLTSSSLKRLSECLARVKELASEANSVIVSEGAFQTDLDSLEHTFSPVFSELISNELCGLSLCSEAFNAVLQVRKVLTWEAATAIALLDAQESLLIGKAHAKKLPIQERNANGTVDEATEHNSSSSLSGEVKEPKGKPNSERKKKGSTELVLGRGTSLVRQLLTGRIHRSQLGGGVSFPGWAEILEDYFDPKHGDFQSFVELIRGVLESNEARRVPKVPKGTRDFSPEQMAIREKAFGIIASVFKRHGAVAIDTPVFELRDTLMGKYGEDSKLIYDLADQGGEICSLRYDLTVPFARYLAAHSISNLKRYHIARVYRRDNPSKGRFREFYQCDFDIAGLSPGQSAPMLPDFEVIKVLTELLDELKIGDYQVKLNHRRLLDGMLDLCGVPPAKFRAICSAIDKLDKLKWEQVREEMVEEKGLSAETADQIGTFVQKKGAPLEVLANLRQDGSPFLHHEGSSHALEELSILFGYLEAADCLHRIVFDLSLARGLDYYTGVIYEAVFQGSTQVGSIAAGGRYDNLVGMFSGKPVPAVGVSLGIERVFAIMESENQNVRATQTEVLVVALGDNLKVAIKVVKELWAAKIKAEFSCVQPNKILKQLDFAKGKQIPWMIVMGQDELDKGIVRLQNVATKEAVEVPRVHLVSELQNRFSLCGKVEFPTVVQ